MIISHLKFSFKAFLRGRGMQFWKPAKFFLREFQIFFCWQAEIDENVTFSSNKKIFSPEKFCGQVECRFGNRSKEFKLKVKNLSPQGDGMMKKHFFHSISFQYFLWTPRRQFWQPCEFFSAKPTKTLLTVRKLHKKEFLRGKHFFFKILLCTRKMPFWKPC